MQLTPFFGESRNCVKTTSSLPFLDSGLLPFTSLTTALPKCQRYMTVESTCVFLCTSNFRKVDSLLRNFC